MKMLTGLTAILGLAQIQGPRDWRLTNWKVKTNNSHWPWLVFKFAELLIILLAQNEQTSNGVWTFQQFCTHLAVRLTLCVSFNATKKRVKLLGSGGHIFEHTKICAQMEMEADRRKHKFEATFWNLNWSKLCIIYLVSSSQSIRSSYKQNCTYIWVVDETKFGGGLRASKNGGWTGKWEWEGHQR